MIKIHIKIRIILWSILAGVILWLLYAAVVPFGKISYVYDFKKNNYFITKLNPDGRVKQPQNNAQKIIGNPVYFSLRTPRRFDEAKLTLKYRRCKKKSVCRPSNMPIIEAGVLADKTIWRYKLKPIENYTLDRLAGTWDVMEKNNVMFLQRQKKYNSLDEFLNNLPPANEIALYHYDLKNNFILPDYTAGGKKTELNHPLRGAYQFYTYIKNEDLNFIFFFSDINKNKDADRVDINLYSDNNLIGTRRLNDDGIAEDNGVKSTERTLHFKVDNLPEGVYKLEVRANDDIITDKIVTKQKKSAFINKIWLYGKSREDNNLNIFTDSRTINILTANPASLQKITAGGKEFNIDKTYKQYTARLTGTSSELIFKRGDIILSGDGVFGFKAGNLINPAFKKAGASLDINRTGINYVVARYHAPKETDGWKEAQASFNLQRAYRENGKYGFILSIPGLGADDEKKDWIEIKKIKIDLRGKNLWEKMRETIGKTSHIR